MTASLHALLDLDGTAIGELLASTAAAPSPLGLAGRVVAVLPFGIAGPPPAAWIAAAGRLGATVLRSDDFTESEPLALCEEAARWADLLVTSHPLQGFSRIAAERTGRPVLNGGEDAGEDPASGLSLLRAALEERPAESEPLQAAVCGDLRGSPGAKALLGALAASAATVLLVPARGKDLDADSLDRLARRSGRFPVRFEARTLRTLLDMVDTVLLAPPGTRQLPLFRQVGVPPEEADRQARRQVEDLDVLVAVSSGGGHRIVREPFRRGRAHLPEGVRHETSEAVLAALLLTCLSEGDGAPGAAATGALRYRGSEGVTCVGTDCAAARLRAAPDFLVLDPDALLLECVSCGRQVAGAYAASRRERLFHPVGSADAGRILDENRIVFRTLGEAVAAGFEASRRIVPAGQGESA